MQAGAVLFTILVAGLAAQPEPTRGSAQSKPTGDPAPGDRAAPQTAPGPLAAAHGLIVEAIDRMGAAAAAADGGDAATAVREAETALVVLRKGARMIPSQVRPGQADLVEKLRALASGVEMSTLHLLGLVHNQQGRHEAARVVIRERLDLAVARDDRVAQIEALTSLAETYGGSHSWQRLAHLEQARALLLPADPPKLAMGIEMSFLNARRTLGQYALALEHAERALVAARRFRRLLGSPGKADAIKRHGIVNEILALTNLGDIQALYLGDVERGRLNYRAASKVAEGQLGLPNHHVPLLSLALAEAVSGNEEEARRLGERAVAAVTAIRSPATDTPAHQGIELGARYVLAEILVSQRRFEEAEAHLERTRALAEVESGYNRTLGLAPRARALILKGKPKEAEALLRQSTAWLDTTRRSMETTDTTRIAFGDEFSALYDLLQTALLEQGKLDEALVVLEKRRGRTWRESAGGRGSPSDLSTVEMRQLASDLDATLVVWSFVYDAATILLPARIAGNQLGAEKALQIWVISPKGTIATRRRPLSSLEGNWSATVRAVSQGVTAGAGRGVRRVPQWRAPDDPLKHLAAILIEPIRDLLPEPGSHLVLVPQGLLLNVPFAALPDPSGRPLIERYPIVTVPSLGVLDLAHRLPGRIERAAPALIVGNPQIDSSLAVAYGLRPLPGAQAEAKRVAALLGEKPLIGGEATRSVVLERMGRASLLHFATHGLLLGGPSDGLPGALVLAPDAADPGLLSARTIMESKLGARIAVLSACSTGLGEITGEGVLGLSYAFVHAGVPSVVVSLWPVPDDSTGVLMTHFYRRQRGEGSLAEALRGAMLATIAEGYTSPRHWAGFALVGRWARSP